MRLLKEQQREEKKRETHSHSRTPTHKRPDNDTSLFVSKVDEYLSNLKSKHILANLNNCRFTYVASFFICFFTT